MTTTVSSKLVERRLNDFKRRCGEYGDAALQLAYHAALPVALNPELLHFLRINFFLDPPDQLPYTVEFELLTSGLCREIDVELYEIDPEIRNILLQELMKREDAPQRIQDVATLLWQYVEYHSPWTDRVELERAQQLTALNFLDPVKAQEWLDEAEANPSQVGRAEREWFVAMRQEIDQLPDLPDTSSNISLTLSGQQRKQLLNALISAFPERSLLEQLLDFELDKELNQITQDTNLQTVVYQLIQRAQAEGWLVDLVRAAQKENPGNSQLNAIATELLANNPTTTPYNSRKEDAIAEYRRKVEEFLADDGEISFVESEILNDLQQKLGLTEEEVRTIRDEALEPFGRYRENLDKYRQVFTKWVDEQGYPLSQKAKADLKKLQEYYQLKDEDIALLFKEAEQQQADDLSSVKSIDYTKLRDFLKAGRWKEADEKTLAVMLKASGRETEGWLNDESIKNFPCTDLRTIDQLWVKYSSGRFGFSVQKQIYLEVGGIPDGNYYPEAWEKFGERVGWRVKKSWIDNRDVTFNTTAPQGHLPCVRVGGSAVGVGVVGAFGRAAHLFSRIETCKL